MTFKIFLDCDGVLADFDKKYIEITGMHPRSYEEAHGTGPFWKIISKHKEGFFSSLDKMPEADELVSAVEHWNPTILTGVPEGWWAINQKLTWRAKNFPHLDMVCCASKDKRLAKDPNKINVLIDDWTKYKERWEEDGSIFVHHTTLENTLDILAKLDII